MRDSGKRLVFLLVKQNAAHSAHKKALAALQSCEQANPENAGSCQSERIQVEERARALKSNSMTLQMSEMIKVATAIRAIREEYPSCEMTGRGDR
jgi:hypothetical protein